MAVEIGFTDELTNTQYAPLAVLCAHYQQHNRFAPLSEVTIPMSKRDFNSADKLLQIVLSILGGCATLSEMNNRLKSEAGLATVMGWERFADQSSLSRTLDALTEQNIEQLRRSTTTIWRSNSRYQGHDWRAYLWLDYDLSALPCSPLAEASQKGYFSGKKTPPDAN